MTAPVFLTYAEAGAIAKVSPNTIAYWVQTGRLSKIKLGRHPMIRLDVLVAALDATATPTVP